MKKFKKVEPGKIILLEFKSFKDSHLKLCICRETSINGKHPHLVKDGVTYASPLAPLSRAILNHHEGEEIQFYSSEVIMVKILKIF